MNTATNGATLRRIIDDNWEVVDAVTVRYIGKVIKDEGDVVELSPAFVYISSPQIQPQPDGQVGLGWQRIVVPLEMMASQVPVRLRWSQRYRIADFDRTDEATFESAVAEAFDNQKKLAAQRAGITVVPQLPGRMNPLPGGRK